VSSATPETQSPPATGGTSTAGSAPRERLLEAAGPLFYREGSGVGVEALCRAAGVSKRTMYQVFASKDDLQAAALDHWAAAVRSRVLPAEGDGADARARILAVFGHLEAASADPAYRGCPYVATAVEVKDPDHPAAQAARRHKQALTDFFADEARRAGGRDPDGLAVALTIVYDGAAARAVQFARPLAGAALTTAATLLDAAGVTAAAGSR
jgi:AcrR family transcriptional regulator